MSIVSDKDPQPRERQLRILQVITVIAPEYGGPSIGSLALNRALRELGHDAEIFTTTLRPDGTSLAVDDLNALAAGARVSAFDANWPRRAHHSWKLSWQVFRNARAADVIHMHGQYLAPHALAYVAAQIRGIPYGVQPHGGLEPYQRAQSRGRKAIYNALVGRRILRGASYVQFASAAESLHAADVVRPAQALVAPLGAALESARESVDILSWLDGTPRHKVVVFLGRLAAKKRPDLLIRQWAEIASSRPDMRLVIAGPDDDFSSAQLRNLARDLGVQDTVLLSGSVHGGEKAWLLRESGIFVLPSENENFGVSVAEAMLSGCAIVVTDRVAASEHVLISSSGVVVREDEEFAKELGRLMDDPAMAHEMGLRGQDYARQELSWKALASSIANAATLRAGKRRNRRSESALAGRLRP